MLKGFSLTVIVLAVAINYAPGQTASGGSGQGSSGEAQSSSQAAQSSQTSNQKGSTSQTQPANPATKVPGGATDASGGGVAGAAGSAVGQSQVPQTPEPPNAAAAPSDSDLQTQIQNALSKEPTLSGDTVNVTVSGDSIDISGSVATSREKQTATRIVQSYAGNKKVASHLTVSGRNHNAAPAAATPKRGESSRPATGDLSSHPEPNKGAPPPTSTRPPL